MRRISFAVSSAVKCCFRVGDMDRSELRRGLAVLGKELFTKSGTLSNYLASGLDIAPFSPYNLNR